ncbi:N-acetyltransferase [Aneurinibacillus tyrosinisolvens]|uniref:N-acetyltransferase n=1 Tax=Aneurinibacillus tyrosinisolvens TaxID=1443435 RepID=UPI00063EDEA9|nr:N-acetyltransferase [Aneurinibacillus tyrosinisolvens]
MISDLAVVQTNSVGKNVTINEFAIIRPDVTIGNNVVIHPHVVINSGVVIEDGVEIFPGAYIGKEPKGAGALARTPVFEKSIVIGANTSIGPHAVIFYDVEIGRNTLIGDGASIREQCKIGSYCIISRYVTINYNTAIGDNTKIMDLTHITGNCKVGNDVFISINVGTTNDNAIGKTGYDENEINGPIIKDGAAIGAGATLLPNITIEKDSIVGAGSVVTKNVESNTLAMGVPARSIRKLNE